MADRIQAVLTFEELGEPEFGVWCDRCVLSTAYRRTGVVLIDGQPLAVIALAVCASCGAELE